MTADATVKAGGGALLIAVAIGLSYGYLTPGPGAASGHVAVYVDGGNDPAAVGIWATARVDASAMPLFGYDGGGAPYVYARAHLCAAPVDGGADPGPDLIPGMDIVYDDALTDVCTSTSPALEAWVQGYPGAPFLCACAMDITCLQGLLPAPQGNTLDPGTWLGPGCYPKACVQIGGTSSWPAACPGGS